jgi:hypothetical protein
MQALHTRTERNRSPAWREDAVDVLVAVAVLAMMTLIVLL